MKSEGVNPEATAILEKYKVSAPNQELMSTEHMQHRIALRFVNEAVMTLQEDIIMSPTDGDIASVFGVGFPARFGGPFKYVDSTGAQNVLDRMALYRDTYGEAFEACDLLKDMAKGGKKFY